jgi:hypothetical protein
MPESVGDFAAVERAHSSIKLCAASLSESCSTDIAGPQQISRYVYRIRPPGAPGPHSSRATASRRPGTFSGRTSDILARKEARYVSRRLLKAGRHHKHRQMSSVAYTAIIIMNKWDW